MEIKILCSCGVKYKFDVEPVNGRVPAPLSCPGCGASWTDFANAFIAQSLGLPPPVPTSSSATASAPPVKSALRVSAPAHVEAAPVAETPLAPPPVEAQRRHIPNVPMLNPVLEPEVSGSRFLMGMLGAVLGAALGGTIYFLIFHYTGFRFKLLGLGIGLLAGLGARWLGKDEGSKELGILAAIFSILGIFFAQYAAAKSFYNEADLEPVESGYEASVAEAKNVITAIPTGSDQEIRLYLAKEEAEEGAKPDLKSVSAEDVKYFRENDLPELRNLADGTITREQFESRHQPEGQAGGKPADKEEEDTGFKWFLLAVTFNKFNLVCMIGAAGLAFKMIANA